MIDKEQQAVELKNVKPAISHVGGISDEMGGVDPKIDSDLMRLSGGP